MTDRAVILNESDVRSANAMIADIEDALKSEEQFKAIVRGLSPEVISGYRRAIQTQKEELKKGIDAYYKAKEGDFKELQNRAGDDIGLQLIIARIANGYSQKELARRLGLKQQQIQRYEAERYKSINITNLQRIIRALGIKITVELPKVNSQWLGKENDLQDRHRDFKKVILHAQNNNWFEKSGNKISDNEAANALQRYFADHIVNYGNPALLRTGINVDDELSDGQDISLVAWKARITKLAEEMIESCNPKYDAIDISWLSDLVKLSQESDGPLKAKKLLLEKGIVLVVEPQISGLNLDGAAFLINDVPVIGLTLRYDRIDNFWFTLLHEIAHVVLHYRLGLNAGFYDDLEKETLDELEQEANDFAQNMLIPREKWRRSPARIAKKSDPIEKLAKDIQIHPAIVYGRVRKERNNYTIFSKKVGQGEVRKWLL